MKAILEFDLEDADDRMAHLRAVKSLEMASVLFEIQNNLHRSCPKTKDTIEVFYKINELINDHHINIDELIV